MVSKNMRTQFLIIQMSIMFPVILVFLMGRRSRKMKFTTYIFGFAYWFIAALESACLLEIVLLGNQYEPTIFTTEAIICIAMIVTNSYAIVTLCSYINPVGLMDNKNTKNKFDFLYSIFFAVSGILFAEIPMLVARCQILSANVENILPGTFYIWLMKDILWLVLIAILVYVQRFGHKYLQLPCKPKHSNKHLYFEPEKRDVYINRYRHSLYQQPSEMDKLSNSSIKDKNLVFNDIQLKKCISEPNIYTCNKSEAAKIISSSSKSNNDIDTVGRCSIEEDIYINDFYSKPFTKKLINGESKTYNTKQENKKHVTFKLELGMGRFLQMKPRSDSPPVYHIETDHIIPD